jgi:LmbE family N-acetylglucosaminyl deacetylase
MLSILAVSAHPDDESLFAGGTLAMFAEQGANVYILETTRGEGGEVGEPPLTTQQNLGAYREQEVRKAARAFGVRDIYLFNFLRQEYFGHIVSSESFISTVTSTIRSWQR